MKAWKTIMAVAVIFLAGLLTGGALVWKLARPSDARRSENPESSPFQPWQLRERYVGYLAKKLQLSAEQENSISQIVAESQHRTKLLMELVGPDMREEMRQVRDSIRAVLTSEQQREFDEIQKRHGRHRKEDDPKDRDGSRERGRDDAWNDYSPGYKRKCENGWSIEGFPWLRASSTPCSG